MKQKQQQQYVFSLVKENTNPTIANVKYPVSVLVPCIDEIYDEETEENRIIRYLPGEKSIFMDEQVNQDMTKRAQITFVNGHLIVDRRQKTLLQFLRMSNRSFSNTNRMPGTKAVYKEYIPGAGAEDSIKLDKNVLQAKNAAYQLEIDELISYARVLGLDVNRDPAEIRYHMSVVAGNDPTKFLAGINNPTTKRKHYFYQALDAGIITLNKIENSVRWTSSGQPIVQAPKGQDILDYVVEFTFNPDGEKVYEHIRELLNPTKSVNIEGVKKEITLELPENDLLDKSSEEIFNLAIELDIIKHKPGYLYHLKGKNIAKGKEKAVEAIDSKVNLKRELIKHIAKAQENV